LFRDNDYVKKANDSDIDDIENDDGAFENEGNG
jgi:hypothetical protein